MLRARMTAAQRCVRTLFVLLAAACDRAPGRWLPADDGLVLPSVAVRGLPQLAPGPWTIVMAATSTSIVLEGQPVASLHNGAIDAAELDPTFRFIPRLKAMLAERRSARPDADVLLFADGRLRCRVLAHVLVTLSEAEVDRLAIVAESGAGRVGIPLLPYGKVTRPVHSGPGGGLLVERGPDGNFPPPPAIGPMVQVGEGKVRLWSQSGEEGTPQKPKLVTAYGPDAPRAVSEALSEIVSRRWPAGKRTDEQRTGSVIASPSTTVQTAAELIVALRGDLAGRALFPDVRLLAMVDEF